jgi:hypothetical protein
LPFLTVKIPKSPRFGPGFFGLGLFRAGPMANSNSHETGAWMNIRPIRGHIRA